MTAADSRIDNEVLKAKLDASVGIAQRLIDSWLPASDDTSTDSIFTQSKHLKGRPARVGLGADFISQTEAAGLVTKEAFELKFKDRLTAAKATSSSLDDQKSAKAQEEDSSNDDMDSKFKSSSDRAESRPTAAKTHLHTRKRIAADPFSSAPAITNAHSKKKRRKS